MPPGLQRFSRLKFEALEDRRLLSVSTPFTAAQQSALITGIQSLAQWTGQLTAYAQLGQQLPLVTDTLGNMANVSPAIQGLSNQLNTDLPGGGSTATPSQIGADLQAISTTVANDGGTMSVSVNPSSVVTSEAADGAPVYFTFDLHGQETLTKSINLGSLVTSSQESFTGTTNVSLTSQRRFHPHHRHRRDPQLDARADVPFPGGQLHGTGLRQPSNIDLAAQVGFLAGTVTGGQLSIAANLQVPLSNAGQMRLSDLQASTVPSLVPQLQDNNSTISASLPFSACWGRRTDQPVDR